MVRDGATSGADVKATLDEAVAILRSAGFGQQAERLVAAAGLPASSSSEILGELGLAVLRVQRDVGHRIPREAMRKLRQCLKGIRTTWPHLALPGDDGR